MIGHSILGTNAWVRMLGSFTQPWLDRGALTFGLSNNHQYFKKVLGGVCVCACVLLYVEGILDNYNCLISIHMIPSLICYSSAFNQCDIMYMSTISENEVNK